ncbi:MAG TPA: class I SAM-dependent methyltransferase, partial [Chroococcales cyanobacterium]
YDQTIHPLALKAKEILDKRKVKQWLSYRRGKELTFLDVGCGNGRYLKMLQALGYDRDKLYGVELSQQQVDRLNQEGYRAFYGRIEEVSQRLPQQSFDLIVILQVLEHVDNPAAVVSTLAQLLRPGGLLIIETPNTESLDLSLFKEKYWGGYHFPRHWNLFNCDNLNLMVEASGLKRRAVNFLPAHTFWIFSFHHLFVDRWHNKFLADLFDPFKNIFLLSVFTGFDIVRAKLGFKTSNVQFIAERPSESRASP